MREEVAESFGSNPFSTVRQNHAVHNHQDRFSFVILFCMILSSLRFVFL